MTTPVSAAEWAIGCLLQGHVPQGKGNVTVGWMCEDCADAYAREQVERYALRVDITIRVLDP